jgi:hypothetical protein
MLSIGSGLGTHAFQPGKNQAAFAAASAILGLTCLFAPQLAHATTPTPTVTTLTIDNSTGHRVAQVNFGSSITLTAAVETYQAQQVAFGTIVFCDGAVTPCLDGHAIGTRQIVLPPGTANNPGFAATLTILPTAGKHTYSAVFLGTDASSPQAIFASSTSPAVIFNVLTPPFPGVTSTALTVTGTAGNYTLKANVLGTGAGQTKPTGSVGFYDTTNSNALLGMAPVGATAFTFGFGTPLTPALPSNVFYFLLSAVADVNNDGIPDLILVTIDPSNTPDLYDILVLLGKGDGTFIFPPFSTATFSTTSTPLAIVTGDFANNDIVDLAISTSDAHLLLFEGSGTGYFGLVGSPIDTNFFISSMAVADLGHSGFQSIVGITPVGFIVFKNNGAGGGTFDFTVGPIQGNNNWSWPASIALADINGDGFTDAVIANSGTDNFTFYLGNGTGTFNQGPSFNVGNAPSAIVLADFNGDGKLDVAVANSGDNTVSILKGDGTGANFTPVSLPAVGHSPQFLVTGDFNDDGVTDLAVGNVSDGSVTVLLGKGDGTFKKSTLTGDVTAGLLAADLNSDGFTDIVAAGILQPDAFLAQLTASTNATLTGVDIAGSGTHNVAASYPGDTNYVGSTSSTVPLTASPLTTALTLTALPNPGTWTGQVTLTATLSPYTAQGHTTDTETVAFYDGATKIGTGSLSLGKASFNIGTLSVGAHSLKAVYGGDTNFAGSTSAVLSFTVGKAASTTTLSAATNSPKVGVADLLTATVTGFSSPRGNVVFTQDGATICTVALGASGTATCSWVPWTTSATNLVATYAGDGDYAGSTSATLKLTATYTFDSKVVMTFDSTTLTYPGATNIKTCVTRATSATPTGTVKIFDDATLIQTLSLGGDGCAYWYINPSLHAGAHHIRADYSGDSHNAGGYSAITTVTVNQVTTSMSVACWNQTFSHGGNYQCNVSVWSNADSPLGSILYSLDGGTNKSATLSSGNTSFVIADPAVGNHTVLISYPGTADYSAVAAQTEHFTVTH